MILASFIKNSSMDYPSHGWFVFALTDQFFMNITSLSRLLIPTLQSRRLIKTLAMLKILSVSIWEPKISKIYQATKDTFRNHDSWIFHQVKGNIESFGFTCKWRNKFNWFLSNPCKVTSFEVTTPKMESSSPSTEAALIKPLEFGLKNKKTTTNKSNKFLLSYASTIYIIFSCPTNVFTTTSDLKCRYNISVNMLWTLLAL